MQGILTPPDCNILSIKIIPADRDKLKMWRLQIDRAPPGFTDLIPPDN
jgi:hypothetical protein